MKKSIGFIIFYSLAFIVTVFNLTFNVRSNLFSDINHLPHGEATKTFSSPNGDKIITLYLVDNALGEAVRGELNDSGKISNIFWQTGVNNVEVYFDNNDLAVINSIPLNLADGGYYDCRDGVSLFADGSLKGEGIVDNDGNVIPKK